MKCSIREFEEESDLNSDEYTLLDNVAQYLRNIGSNGVRYKFLNLWFII